MHDPGELLAALVDGGVDFVVLGGLAVVAHGHIRTTRDLDITYATTAANLAALGKVLVAIDARLRGVTDVVPFTPDDATLRRASILTLTSPLGDLDLLAEPPGAPAYAALRERASAVELDGRAFRVASIPDLIAMKRRAGRPQDLTDVEALEAIERLRRSGAGSPSPTS